MCILVFKYKTKILDGSVLPHRCSSSYLGGQDGGHLDPKITRAEPIRQLTERAIADTPSGQGLIFTAT